VTVGAARITMAELRSSIERNSALAVSAVAVTGGLELQAYGRRRTGSVLSWLMNGDSA
jgi:hypothetical protein